jgi:hypothetical protein
MKNEIKVFMGRLILPINDEFHEVELFSKKKKLKKGFGYIKGHYVYIFRGKLEKYEKDNLLPGIYLNKEDEYIFIEPKKENKNIYHIDNIMELNLDKIFEDIENNKNEFIQEEDIETINNNSGTFKPTIKDSDDFLKLIIKQAIIIKQPNIKKYKNKFSVQHAFNNLKSSLEGTTKMSVDKFLSWTELLGLDWTVIIEDNGKDKNNPLKEPIIISSKGNNRLD